jgi:plastocyanin
VGVFNREDSPVNVTFTIFDGGSQVGSPVTASVAAHSGAQVNRIFNAAGDPNHATENAVIVVAASHEVFSYAAVIDNTTTDPIFIVGAEDNPPQAFTPGATTTPTQPGATATPSRTQTPSPTRTPTPPASTRNVSVGAGGLRFTDAESHTSTSTITAGTTVNWSWSNGFHSVSSTSSESFDSGEHDAPFSFSHRFNTIGEFPPCSVPA